ncbi:MAG TPA: PrsW family glutamic-type intramembrane protease, partial [Pyrinomonadaceae bacterium]|nr:PrsW family glutamic-type intramembrane protease [Pyrinomonadaceae bacterium]
MKLRLTITSGMLSGQRFPLETGFLTIGRGENCTVRFDPRGERIASKQHAFIEARPDGYYITDNQSTNGTLVNGQKIQKVKLNSGDEIQFGTHGVTATVAIDLEHVAPVEQFRARQIQNFEDLAEGQPQNLQNSVVGIGLGQLEPQPEPSRTGRYVGIGVTVFAIVFMSLIVALIMFASVGVIPAVIAAIIAFLPAVIYLFPLMWLDRYDPEPLWLLSLAFAWGALVAVIASFVINTVIGTVAAGAAGGGEEGMIVGNIVGAVISAPIFEEASKGIGLLVLLIFFRRYFDDILDGIVFAGVIALGFATVENVMYYGDAIGRAGLPGVVLLFVMRGVLSPFAHVTFTAMTGIGCGLARESHSAFLRFVAPVIGYFFAVLLHGFWNGLAVFGGLETFLAGYLVL